MTARTHVERVQVGAHELAVSVAGDGPPLLLINGFGANMTIWEPLRPALNAKTIVFDGPGVGRSSMPRLPLTIPQLATSAVRLLDTLGYDQVDVLGVSLGGVVAEQVAIQSPERVRRLVLASTTWGIGMVPGNPKAWTTLLSPRRYYVPGYYERVAKDFVGGRTGRDPTIARAYGASRRAQPPNPLGHLFQMVSGSTWCTLPSLHRISAPTLILTGDDDPLIPPTNSRILHRLIRNSQLGVIPGGGHLLIFDSVDEVAPVINSFLSDPMVASKS